MKMIVCQVVEMKVENAHFVILMDLTDIVAELISQTIKIVLSQQF